MCGHMLLMRTNKALSASLNFKIHTKKLPKLVVIVNCIRQNSSILMVLLLTVYGRCLKQFFVIFLQYSDNVSGMAEDQSEGAGRARCF